MKYQAVIGVNSLFWHNGVILVHAFSNARKSLGGHTKTIPIVEVNKILLRTET